VPGHVFVSYSRTDAAYVELLGRHLRGSGVDVWVDSNIDYGTRWELEIRTRIDTCSALIVVMSPEAEESPWVANEVSRAQTRQKPVYPLLLRGEGFFRLGHLQHEDVRGDAMPDQRFIATLLHLTPTPPGPPRQAATRTAPGATTTEDNTAGTLGRLQIFETHYRRYLLYVATMASNGMLNAPAEVSGSDLAADYFVDVAKYLAGQLDELREMAIPTLAHRAREYYQRVELDLMGRHLGAQQSIMTIRSGRALSMAEAHALVEGDIARLRPAA
jgi:hypothetical protein